MASHVQAQLIAAAAIAVGVTGCSAEAQRNLQDGALLAGGPLVLIVLFSMAAATGAAEEDPVPVIDRPDSLTCAGRGLTSTSATIERKAVGSATMSPPRLWCVLRESIDSYEYYRHPLAYATLTEEPTDEVLAHALLLRAFAVDASHMSPSARRDLNQLARTWISAGLRVDIDSSGARRPNLTQAHDGPMVDPLITLLDFNGTACAEYSFVREEIETVSGADVRVVHRETGRICRGRGSSLVVASFLERYIKDNSADPTSFNRLLGNVARPFFDSFDFHLES